MKKIKYLLALAALLLCVPALAAETRVLGDVNDDGKTGSLLDILYLKKYLAGFSVKINQLNADMNEDGEVKLADLILLMQQYVEEKIEG